MFRSNFELKAAISFHGLLESNIVKNKISIPKYSFYMVTMIQWHHQKQVNKFQQEMDKRKTDWQLHTFGNTYHAFTNPNANDHKFGTVFNKLSNKRVWKLAEDFFREAFVSRFTNKIYFIRPIYGSSRYFSSKSKP